ncbi:MAG TPA: hypothetical protein DCP10_06715 [Bacteroidales bacterium]|nr:hypothetical protein [Bacteroidales bacterium]
MARAIPSRQVDIYKRGVSDSLLEDRKDYDGYIPFDLPHKDAARKAYKQGREEGDKLKKEAEESGLGYPFRRGVSDSMIADRDYNGHYKPMVIRRADLENYKKGRVEGDKLRKEIEKDIE